MNTNKLLLLFSFIFFSLLTAQSQCYWAKSFEGSATTGSPASLVNSVTTDGNGNVFTTGYIWNGTFDFDPGPSVSNKTVGDYTCFVSKLDSAGNFAWVKFFGGANPTTGPCRGLSLKTDNSGNVYITGYFSFTIDFDPGVGISNLSTGSGTPDAFICKLDNNGNFIWAKKIGSTGAEYSNSINLDPTGNIIISGYFQNTSDFDPGAAVFNLTSAGSDDIFILKLDNSGNFLWAKSIGSTTVDRSNSVTTDAIGNIISTGYFQGTVDFDPGAGIVNLVSTGSSVFISKLDPNGNYITAKKIGGGIGNSVCTDQNNNIILAAGSGNFKLDSIGNILWSINVGGPSNSIASDIFGNIYSTGNLVNDVYVRKIDSNGNLLMLKQFGGSYTDEGKAIAVDNSGGIITTGMFQGMVDFNPDIDTIIITTPMAGNNPSQNIFIHKIFTNVSLPLIISNSPIYCVGDTVILSTANATSYNWSTSNNSQSINITTSGSFYVTTFNYCYATSLPFNVTFNPLPSNPTIANNGPTLYCQATPAPISNVLTSSSATGYQWSTGENTQSITVTSGGTYTISIVDNNGCQSSSSLTINVSPVPISVATNSGPYCIGSTLNLSASGGSTYYWSGPGGFTSTLQNPSRANSTTAMSGTYSVTVINANGCNSTASTNVTVNTLPASPVVSASRTVTFCQGDSVILTSNYTFGNLWSNGATSQSIIVRNSGQFSVIHNNGSCSSNSSITVTVTVHPNAPTPTISANGPLTFCQGDSVRLTTNHVSNGTTSTNSWSNGSTAVGGSQTYTVRTSGVYTVSYYYTPISGQYYCPSTSAPVTVTVLNPPNIPTITSNGPTTICQGDSVILSSNYTGGNIWSNGATTSTIVVRTAGTYSLRNTNGTCTSNSSNPVIITVVQRPVAPVITASGPLSFCKGNMVTLTANQGSGLSWSTGDTSSFIDVYDAGIYSLSVSNGVCPTQTTSPITITVNNPDINIMASGQLAENSTNTSITFTANVTNVGSNPIYQWYKNGLTVGSNSPTYTNNNWVNGEKIVCRVTNSSGCSVYSNDLFVWLAQTTQDSWQRMADVGLDRNIVDRRFPGRIGAISFVIGNKIYVGLGYAGNEPQLGLYGKFYSDFWEYNPQTDEWTERAPFAYGNSSRINASSFVVNGKAYVGFGRDEFQNNYNDLWEYNPQTDSWTQKSSCPTIGRQSAIATSLRNSGYIGSGTGTNINDWWKYTPATDSWTQLTNIPLSQRYGNTCSILNNKIYVTGGGGHYVYDTETDSWAQKTSVPRSLIYAESFVIDNFMYVVGGQNSNTGTNSCDSMTTKKNLWQYNPSTDSWTQKADMNLGNISNGCAISLNGQGYFICGGAQQNCIAQNGGFVEYGGREREAMIVYTPTTNSWETKSPLGGMKNNFGFSCTIGNKGYTLMQYWIYNDNNPYIDSTEVYLFEYDVLNNSWKQKSKYPGLGIYQCGGGFALNGKIYFGSGASSINNYVTDFWEYNPITDTWTNIGNVPIAVSKPFSFVLNGKGYLGGNQMGTSFFEFNPTTLSWTSRASVPHTPFENICFSINNNGYLGTLLTSTTGLLYKYDPSNNMWTSQGNLPTNFTQAGFSFTTLNKGFYGLTLNSPNCQIYEYDYLSNIWSQKSNLTKSGLQSSSFSFPDKAFVFSGNEYYNPGSLPVNDLWQYNPGGQVTAVENEMAIDDKCSIFPNPTHDQITISASANYIGKNYRIFDYTGKLLQSNTIQSENTTISLSDLPSGLYLLRIEGNNHESYKIVKL